LDINNNKKIPESTLKLSEKYQEMILESKIKFINDNYTNNKNKEEIEIILNNLLEENPNELKILFLKFKILLHSFNNEIITSTKLSLLIIIKEIKSYFKKIIELIDLNELAIWNGTKPLNKDLLLDDSNEYFNYNKMNNLLNNILLEILNQFGLFLLKLEEINFKNINNNNYEQKEEEENNNEGGDEEKNKKKKEEEEEEIFNKKYNFEFILKELKKWLSNDLKNNYFYLNYLFYIKNYSEFLNFISNYNSNNNIEEVKKILFFL
jgi:hypothetical protein